MPGPTIRRKQLGIKLRELREAAGVTRLEAAKALRCSHARIGHIEVGKNALGYAELRLLLLELYGADEVTLAELEEVRQEATKRGWWSTYGLPEWLAGYVGLEHDAKWVRNFELELIPGMHQTEEYARAAFALDDRWTSDKEIGQRIAARMNRQGRLVEPDNPLQFTSIISEAALLRCAAHASVAGAQIAKLIEHAQLPNVEILVLPVKRGLHVGMSGPYSLLSFEGLLPDTAYLEHSAGAHLVDDHAVVSQLDKLWDKLRSQALADDGSLALLAELARQIPS